MTETVIVLFDYGCRTADRLLTVGCGWVQYTQHTQGGNNFRKAKRQSTGFPGSVPSWFSGFRTDWVGVTTVQYIYVHVPLYFNF